MATTPIEIHFSLIPADNRRLASLCGQQDEHIRQIEDSLGVKISSRGNDFRISGLAAGVQLADKVLKALYQSAESSEPLTPSDVHLALKELAMDASIAFAKLRAKNGVEGESGEAEVDSSDSAQAAVVTTPKRKIKARSTRQATYLSNIRAHNVNFGIGPAGTGKTYLAVACAVEALQRNEVQRIILVRPAVEAGERLGFLPGDLEQKVDPYLRPLYDALHDMFGAEKVAKLMERNIIELAPLAYMRGRTLNDAFIILDEAQNTTPEQMKMFLTRIGFGTTAVITGDTTQVDLPRNQRSGLKDSVDVLAEVKGISFMHFTNKDVVRHPLVQKIVKAYESHEAGERLGLAEARGAEGAHASIGVTRGMVGTSAAGAKKESGD